jgi:hypothetical protein
LGITANFKGGVDKYAQRVRNNSVAFIGENTMSDAKSIQGNADKLSQEIAFVGIIGKDREIRLTELPMGENNKKASVDNFDKTLDANYSKKEQSNIFMTGHVHYGKLLGGWTIGDGGAMTTHQYLGQPSNPNSGGSGDYGPYLYRDANATGRGQAAALIVTPYGITVYGSATSSYPNPYGGYITNDPVKPSNNSYILYKSLKQ